MHYDEAILPKSWKLEKNMIKYSSYNNHLCFSLHCRHNKKLMKNL